MYSAAKHSRGEGTPPHRGIGAVGPDQVPPANRPSADRRGPRAEVETGDRRSGAHVGPGGAGPAQLIASQLASGHRAHERTLRVEHAAASGERHLAHALEAELIRQAEPTENVDRLEGQTAGAGLGSDLGALLGDDDLAAGVRQDLGSPKPGRSGADDQDFNRIHAGSARRRSAIAARSAAEGFGVMPVCRSTARPRL